MPDDLLLRLRDFHEDYFPRHQQRFQDLVAQGQHPSDTVHALPLHSGRTMYARLVLPNKELLPRDRRAIEPVFRDC